MKPFRVITLLTAAHALLAQEGAVSFDLRNLHETITIQEIVTVAAFVGLVAGGVFALIRRRKDETPKMRLSD